VRETHHLPVTKEFGAFHAPYENAGREMTKKERLEALIEAMDRPLLVLAIVTMMLYLLDLRGLFDQARPAYFILMMFIDFVFLFDLVLKLRTLGKDYIHTPWFLIDLLSCLPVLDVLANGVLSFRAIRFIRGFRILRILRGLRVLRAFRHIPAFEQLTREAAHHENQRKFHRYMNIAMITLTIVVLIIIVAARRSMEGRYLKLIDATLQAGPNAGYLKLLGGSFERPKPTSSYVTREITIDGVRRTVYFNFDRVERRSDEIEFFLILGMIITMLFFMYIMAYHQLDVSQGQLRALLNLALPKQVAEQFVIDPHAYEQKCRMPASILFMDLVGFTHTCEELAHNPDQLSSHLEAAMDRLVGELVKHDLIIDKFIGDAVMSFRGGPLVSGDLPDHAYRTVRAALDSSKALARLDDPYFRRVKIGGASSDDSLIGAFGTSVRLSYTILGDAVNLAARLEPACAQCGTSNLFDEATYRLCADRPDLAWRRWGRIRVAGKAHPVEVFEAFDAADVGEGTFIDTFHRALEVFEHNDFDRARELFLLADHQRPGGDEPSRSYAHWCERLLLTGAPVGWEPVYETHK
jgi:class 3 adenylate cyclase